MAQGESLKTFKEAARELGISRQTMSEIVKRIGITPVKMTGNAKYIRATDRHRILEFFESHKLEKEMAS